MVRGSGGGAARLLPAEVRPGDYEPIVGRHRPRTPPIRRAMRRLLLAVLVQGTDQTRRCEAVEADIGWFVRR